WDSRVAAMCVPARGPPEPSVHPSVFDTRPGEGRCSSRGSDTILRGEISTTAPDLCSTRTAGCVATNSPTVPLAADGDPRTEFGQGHGAGSL
ncbi:hypothetical protein OY671_013139, partial [Metschnikowia pulcherrima]